MNINDTYLPIWKKKLNKAKKNIENHLNAAKANGGKTKDIRIKIKQELKIAKSLKKSIKEIESVIKTNKDPSFRCPNCQCELILVDEKLLLTDKTNE
jgi:hypothetical protein